MALKVYKIAPNADTIIVLKNPLLEFAPWDEPATNSAAIANSLIATDDGDTKSRSPAVAIELADEAHKPRLFGGDAIAFRSRAGAIIASKTDESIAGVKANDAMGETSKIPTEGIHYHCSSAHLKLASKTFQKALSGGWAEGVPREDGRRYIEVEAWDEKALHILLNIFHLRYDQVPRKPDFEQLAKLATLIDYYQCREATAICTEIWIEALHVDWDMPTIYGRDLILYIFVSCIFKDQSLFKRSTEIAINTGTDGTLRTLGLPIPPAVSNCIEEKRRALIFSLVNHVEAAFNMFRKNDYRCPRNKDHSFLCGSVMLGALTKALDSTCLSPLPSEPYNGVSLEGIRDELGKINKVLWRTPSPNSHRFSDLRSDELHPCNLKDEIDDMLKAHELSSGVSMEDCGLDAKSLK